MTLLRSASVLEETKNPQFHSINYLNQRYLRIELDV